MRLTRLAVLMLVVGLVAHWAVATGPAPGQVPSTSVPAPPAAASGLAPVTVYSADTFMAANPNFQASSEEQKLERQSQILAQRYGKTENREEREKLRDELNKALNQQFDAQQQRRKEDIERVEAQLKKLRELMQKREDAKRTIVQRRLEQMLQDAEGLGWTATGTGPGTSPFAPVTAPPSAGQPPASTRPR